METSPEVLVQAEKRATSRPAAWSGQITIIPEREFRPVVYSQ